MTDAPPEAGGFAPIVDEHEPVALRGGEPEPPQGEPGPEPPPETEPAPQPPEEDVSPREVMKDLRALLKQEVFPLIAKKVVVDWASSKFSDAIADAVAKLRLLEMATPAEVDLAVQRALEEALAADDSPKTLAELQTPPTRNVGGYDDHHLVQQNDGNIAKSPFDVHIEKFGWNVINAPSNRVRIPRVKHRLITDWYNSTDPNDSNGRLRRQVVSDMDYDAQYQDALTTLQMFGVLQ
jgi:hypothetical protein